MPLVSWKQSSLFIALGNVFCLKSLRACLNNQKVLSNTFLTIFEWYLCDKYAKSNHNFNPSFTKEGEGGGVDPTHKRFFFDNF